MLTLRLTHPVDLTAGEEEDCGSDWTETVLNSTTCVLRLCPPRGPSHDSGPSPPLWVRGYERPGDAQRVAGQGPLVDCCSLRVELSGTCAPCLSIHNHSMHCSSSLDVAKLAASAAPELHSRYQAPSIDFSFLDMRSVMSTPDPALREPTHKVVKLTQKRSHRSMASSYRYFQTIQFKSAFQRAPWTQINMNDCEVHIVRELSRPWVGRSTTRAN